MIKVNNKFGIHLIDNTSDYINDKINNMHKNLKSLHFCTNKNTQTNAD